jgi:hypothetical protein
LLVIAGEPDEVETQANCRHLASVVPDARLEVFEGTAHMVNLEQPKRLNRLLRDFLDANRCGYSTLPGLRIPNGSSATLIDRITSTASAPRCSTRNGRREAPIPCSPVTVPPMAIAAR